MKKILSLALVIIMIFTITATAFAAPAPKPGVDISGNSMTWSAADKETVKAKFPLSTQKDKIVPATATPAVPSARQNASGDKITSNAHSGDFPGLYFYWDDKQKDDGFLKVDPAVFKWFEDGKFYITAKNSNAYWDYWIIPEKGVKTSEGFLLYQIPRYFMYIEANNKNGKVTEVKDELKNINMIFIDGLWRTYDLEIVKAWSPNNEAGAVATLTNGYSFGKKLGIRLYFNESANINFKENNIASKIIDDYKYDFSFVSVSVNGEVSNENQVDFDAKSGKAYKIVFTNTWKKTPLPSKITVTKTWDFGDLPEEQWADLKQLLKFRANFDVDLFVEQTVDANTKIKIKEVPIGWTYTCEDDENVYDFSVVCDDTKYNFITGRNKAYVLEFANKVVMTTSKKASVVVTKEWGGEFDELPDAVKTELGDLLEFEVDGFAFDGLDVTKYVRPGTALEAFEVAKKWSYTTTGEDGITYIYKVDWDDTTYAVAAAGAGAEYVFAFTNVVTRAELKKPLSYKPLDKLESEAHTAKWWNAWQTGPKSYARWVFCNAASTISFNDPFNEGKYFVAMDNKAFSFSDDGLVAIGFGSGGGLTYIMTFDAGGNYKIYDAVASGGVYYLGALVELDIDIGMFVDTNLTLRIDSAPYLNPNPKDFDVDIIYSFYNLFGSGAMQAWYLEITG